MLYSVLCTIRKLSKTYSHLLDNIEVFLAVFCETVAFCRAGDSQPNFIPFVLKNHLVRNLLRSLLDNRRVEHALGNIFPQAFWQTQLVNYINYLNRGLDPEIVKKFEKSDSKFDRSFKRFFL